MWLFLQDSFLSIVAHRDKPGVLLVRARAPGDIISVFPDAEPWEDAAADYRFRAEVAPDRLVDAVEKRVRAINYENFKDTVHERTRHDAYMQVWDVMRQWGDGHGPWR